MCNLGIEFWWSGLVARARGAIFLALIFFVRGRLAVLPTLVLNSWCLRGVTWVSSIVGAFLS